MTTLANEASKGLGRKLGAHEQIALAAIAILVTVPKPKPESNTPSAVISRELLTDLETALISAGYDMATIKARVAEARKESRTKADHPAAAGRQ